MAIVALIGPPGHGKSTMACLTAVRKPVHVVDIDRKIKSMFAFQNALAKGELTYKEIGETLNEEKSLTKRLDALVKLESGLLRAPRGWSNFANYVGTLEEDETVKKSGTLVIDSYTQLAPHLRAHIQFLRGKSKFVFDDWSTWKAMWAETTTILVDYALTYDKDLIITLHERVSKKPGEQTSKVMVRRGDKGEQSKEYLGTMDVRIAGSIEGAFGLEFGTYFTDVYALKVVVDSAKKPTWRCRVLPDGQRDLRCSFDVKEQAEWEPDFRKIWGTNK